MVDPLTSDSKVLGEKGKVRFPCRLSEGRHQNHLCPHMDVASKLSKSILFRMPTFSINNVSSLAPFSKISSVLIKLKVV